MRRKSARYIRRGRRRLFLVSVMLLFLLFFYIQRRLPIVQAELYEAAMTRHGESVITKTVGNALDADFVQTDANTVILDHTVLAQAKSELTSQLQKRLDGKICVWVPFGNLCRSPLLNGHGVKIPVVLFVQSTVQIAFDPQLEAAGINRTRYGVDMVITAKLYSLSAAVSGCVTVETRFPIYDAVLSGEVPQYISVP